MQGRRKDEKKKKKKCLPFDPCEKAAISFRQRQSFDNPMKQIKTDKKKNDSIGENVAWRQICIPKLTTYLPWLSFSSGKYHNTRVALCAEEWFNFVEPLLLKDV